MDIHHFIHAGRNQSSEKLDAILSKLETIIASNAEFQAALDAIDADTTQIAAYLDTVAGQVGSMTKAEEDTVKARLGLSAKALRAMAQSVENPVPFPSPVEPPPVEPPPVEPPLL